jgi:hypothetical protein
MNEILKNPTKHIRKFNLIAFLLLFISILIYQTTILLQNHYIAGETVEFGLSNQDRLLSQQIESNLVSSLISPDDFSRNRHINSARQNINLLTSNHNELLNSSLHFPLFHHTDDITRQIYEEATPYLEKMHDAVFFAVANNEKTEFNEAEKQSVYKALESYRLNQQLFINLINKGINLSTENAESYLIQLPIISWFLVIFIVMLLNHRLIYTRSAKTAESQFYQLSS